MLRGVRSERRRRRVCSSGGGAACRRRGPRGAFATGVGAGPAAGGRPSRRAALERLLGLRPADERGVLREARAAPLVGQGAAQDHDAGSLADRGAPAAALGRDLFGLLLEAFEASPGQMTANSAPPRPPPGRQETLQEKTQTPNDGAMCDVLRRRPPAEHTARRSPSPILRYFGAASAGLSYLGHIIEL